MPGMTDEAKGIQSGKPIQSGTPMSLKCKGDFFSLFRKIELSPNVACSPYVHDTAKAEKGQVCPQKNNKYL